MSVSVSVSASWNAGLIASDRCRAICPATVSFYCSSERSTLRSLTLVLQWYYLKRIRCNWGGGNKWLQDVSQVLCYLEINFQRLLYACFRWQAFQWSPCQLSLVISLFRNSRWRPKTGSSFILARVVVSQRYLSRLLCYPGRKLNATIVIQTKIYLDVTFQDGGGKLP